MSNVNPFGIFLSELQTKRFVEKSNSCSSKDTKHCIYVERNKAFFHLFLANKTEKKWKLSVTFYSSTSEAGLLNKSSALGET
jgi:hypothetical protein